MCIGQARQMQNFFLIFADKEKSLENYLAKWWGSPIIFHFL